MRTSYQKRCIAMLIILPATLLLSACSSMQQIALADAHQSFLRGNYNRALYAISRAESYANFKNPEEKAALLLLKGCCLQRLNQIEKSKEVYEHLIDNYPRSPSAIEAHIQLTAISMIGQQYDGNFKAPTLFPFPQTIQLNTDSRVWKCGFAAVQNNQAIIEYILSGETVHNWSELVTVHFVKDGQRNGSVRRQMEVQKELLLQQNPDSTWSILKENPNEILYEWSHPTSKDWPAQHQISKLITNESGLYNFFYVKKTPSLDEDTYNTWTKIIGTASVQ